MNSSDNEPLQEVGQAANPTLETCVDCKNWKSTTRVGEFILVRLLWFLEKSKGKILNESVLNAIHVFVLCSAQEAREIYQNKPDKE